MAERIRITKGVHIYRRPDSPIWWADISQAGQRTRRSTRTENEAEARQVARSFAADARQVVVAGFTLESAYLQWLTERDRSDTDRSALRVLREKLDNRPAHLVTNGDVALALAGMSPGAYNRIVNVLRAALNLAAERGQIEKAPKLSKKPEAADRVRFLSPEEWARLKPCLPAHLLPAVEFSLATGLRQSNVLGLRWDQVDMRRKLLHLAAADMKSGRYLTVPLGLEAMRVLRGQKGESDAWVFPYRGKRVRSPKTGFLKALKDAGVENFRWHDLRHTWASWMAMSGAPLHAIQQAGGWASMDMVARYSHLTPSAIGTYQDAAVEALRATKNARTRRKAA